MARVSQVPLELDDVTVGYSTDIDILQDVSLAVPEGQLRGLIGLNGAGKSTVLKTATGFLSPRTGRVLLYGTDITGIDPHRCLSEGLYMLPQESSLFRYMSVKDNLRLISRQRGSELNEVIELFPGLRSYLDSKAGNLSGGWQKMVEFAKALLAKPRVLLVDEPSIGLSPDFARQVYDWIEIVRSQEVPILLVDHNIRKLVELADHVYVLSLGRIVAEGPSSKFRDDLKGEVRQWLGLEAAASR